MIKKTNFYCFLALIATFCLSFHKQSYALTFTEFVYSNAKTNNLKAIQTFLLRGYNIDAVDGNGLTALCYAIEYKDFNAYNNLIKLGANSNHKCTQNVNEQILQNYTQRNSAIQNTPKTKYTSDNNKLKIGTGIVAAGGVAALLASGGGGSSSNKEKPTPPTPEDFDEDNEGWYDEEVEDIVECPEGYAYVNNECKPIPAATGCKEGEKLVNGTCVPILCPEGYHLVGSSCLPDMGQSDNLIEINGGYVSTGNVNIENETNDDIYAVYSNGSEIYNLYSVYAHPDDYKKIDITNSGNGNVAALYSEGHATNAFVDGYREQDEINPKNKGSGIIKIQNYGDGIISGVHSKVLDATNSFEASNSYGVDTGTAQALIDIKNYGTNKTYGIYGDDRVYNAISMTQGKSYGDINIEANGDIYGINAYMAAMNATSHQFYPGHISVGNININSIGNGDVYGINIAKAVKHIEGSNVQQWFAINAAGTYKDIVKGNINITNQGNGNVYGMHGGQQLFNGLFYGSTTADGLPTSRIFANINILNSGNGDVYGMYMPEADMNGIIANINMDGYYDETIGQTGVTSTINLVNTGDGVTTGLRGGQFTRIQNTGTININNLGNGTAIGIYGETDSRIENGGTINIYRQEYTDESTGTTYTPTSKTGGTAYGIYAETRASVINTGTINITDAADGKGVYLENGATLENYGTINFNNTKQNGHTGDAIDIYGDKELASVVDFNSMGEGEIVLGTSGRFFGDTLKGDLSISTSPTKSSFEDTYTLSSSLHANNIDELNLKSKSYMFDATSKQSQTSGTDVILTRKNFNSLIDNKEIAEFLEFNYQNENNVSLYDNLKDASSKSQLNTAVANSTGSDIIPSFRRENAIIYRNLSREFNNNLFNKPNENYIVGYKYIDISNDADKSLQQSDGTANVAYGLLKSKNKHGLTYGIGANITKLKTDYDNNSTRDSNQLGLWMPLGYDFNNGLRWYSKLYAGYADSSYERITSLSTKKADYNELQLGLNSEVRYAINLPNSLKFEPLLELNYLNSYQDNIKESNAADALSIKSNNASSLELGMGAYLSKDFLVDDKQKLTIQIGGVYYVEFLDPDNALNATMNNMDGKFSIAHKQNNNRGVASLRAAYNYQDILLYGNIEKDFGAIDAFSIDAGIQYKF